MLSHVLVWKATDKLCQQNEFNFYKKCKIAHTAQNNVTTTRKDEGPFSWS